MNYMNRVLSVSLVIAMVATLFAGCGNKLEVQTTNPPATEAPAVGGEEVETPVAELTFAQGTVLRMATGYNYA